MALLKPKAKLISTASISSVGGNFSAGLTLPTEPSEPVHDINQYHGVITGEPGIGKTTLGMQDPNVFLLSFDPSAKSLQAFQRHAANWKQFIGYLELLESEVVQTGTSEIDRSFRFTRVIVDGADLWFRACQSFVCDKLKIDHPQDEAWGKGWDALAQEFIKATDRLLRLPCGVWFICHAKYKELEKRDGTREEKLRPLLTARAEEVLVGKCDFMLNLHYRGDVRIGTIRGSQDIAAKNRIDNHFLTPDGRQVVEIVMGNDGPAAAWQTFLNAFNNEQSYTTYDEMQRQNRPVSTTKPQLLPSKGGLLKHK